MRHRARDVAHLELRRLPVGTVVSRLNGSRTWTVVKKGYFAERGSVEVMRARTLSICCSPLSVDELPARGRVYDDNVTF